VLELFLFAYFLSPFYRIVPTDTGFHIMF
jgi:hypothetical protein